MTSFVLALGAATSWGQMPSTNDTSGGGQNTGGGSGALVSVTVGPPHTGAGTNNTAYGWEALFSNTTGADNEAFGSFALTFNVTGSFNAAFGDDALFVNTSGSKNTAIGTASLGNNTTGNENTSVGVDALVNNTAGNNNIAIGGYAGSRLISGDNNIYLGHKGPGGNHTESQTMRLGQQQTRTFIAGVATSPLTGSPVVIAGNGRLGIVASSARYKREIADMRERSQGLYQLRPVTFRYKQDAQGPRQYGLIAEEVAKVYPELVTKGADGKVESVQYHELIPMLLNEVQHQQQKLATQAQELAELKAQNERLQAALEQRDAEQRAQTAALAARLEQLEHEPHSPTVAAR